MSAVFVRSYPEPEIDRDEVLRYLGCGKSKPQDVAALIDKCVPMVMGKLSCKVCYRSFGISFEEDVIDLGFAKTESRALRKNLTGCTEIILFAATVGIEMDRLIAKYSSISQPEAVCLQAIGAERIEALCDVFNDEIKKYYEEKGLSSRPRFSPGYGDLPLSLQKDIFSVLDCSRKIGASLNESLLMSPSKSVTAIIGIGA